MSLHCEWSHLQDECMLMWSTSRYIRAVTLPRCVSISVKKRNCAGIRNPPPLKQQMVTCRSKGFLLHFFCQGILFSSQPASRRRAVVSNIHDCGPMNAGKRRQLGCRMDIYCENQRGGHRPPSLYQLAHSLFHLSPPSAIATI